MLNQSEKRTIRKGLFMKCCAFMLIAILSQNIMSQDSTNQEKKDTVKKDSTVIYKKIEKISKQHQFSKFVYSLIFRPVASLSITQKQKNQKVKKDPYRRYEGKIIRNISVTSLDPFGFDIHDTSVNPKNIFLKIGDKIHIKTKPLAIKNLLLFKEKDIFDSLLVKESERLIRSQKFIRDVVFFPVTIRKTDSVDIYIVVQDLWTISADGGLSASRVSIDLTDQNFLGLGYRFQNVVTKYSGNRNVAFETNYYVPNISNTYINTTMQYKITADRNYIKRFDIERPFYSSFAKWAGGISVEQHMERDSIFVPLYEPIYQNFKFNIQDLWVGRAWNIFKGKSEYDRTTNLILSGRFLNIRYLERPTGAYDTLNVFTNERFFLVQAGINTQRYIQDKYVFSYGLIEDVPIGQAYSILAGYQVKNNQPRLYLGIKISWGDYFERGYFGNDIEYGTFIRKNNVEQGVIRFGFDYFTNLMQIGRWRFRQFARPEMTIGLHRFPSDNLSIFEDSVLRIYTLNNELKGIHRVSLTLQTQAYAPWTILGFKFGPYLSSSFAMLGTSEKGFRGSRLYSQFNLGLLIRNEFLVFKYLQVSVSFFPFIPNAGKDIFRANSYKTTDFGFPGFGIGKPLPVAYF